MQYKSIGDKSVQNWIDKLSVDSAFSALSIAQQIQYINFIQQQCSVIGKRSGLNLYVAEEHMLVSNSIDSFSEVNKNHENTIWYQTVPSAAQSFTGDGSVLSSCKFYLKLATTPPPVGTQFCRAMIYAHSGTYGVSSVGVGNPWGYPSGFANYLALSQELDISTISTDFSLIEFTFATPYTLAKGTHYVVVFENDGVMPITIGCYYNALGVISAFPSIGNATYFNFGGGWFAVPTLANCFYVNKVESSMHYVPTGDKTVQNWIDILSTDDTFSDLSLTQKIQCINFGQQQCSHISKDENLEFYKASEDMCLT